MLQNGSWRSHGLCALFLLCALTGATSGQTITIDNSDDEFTILYGDWSSGTYGQPCGSDYDWALTTGYGSQPAEVEWRPDLPAAGAYQVAVWYVPGSNRANNAVFTVHHSAGATPVVVNQQVDGQTWRSLGTFAFAAGTGGFVRLHNDANPSVVIADAVRFTPVTTTAELTMDVSPPGWGETEPPAGETYAYSFGEVVAISAAASPGYAFHHWVASDGAAPADPSAATTTVVLDVDKTLTAVFVEETPVPAEFRGFWADAFHVGFKSQAQIDDMIARAIAGNYNAIVPEVMAFQDYSNSNAGHGAYWDSAIVPRAHDIVGSFDPLAYLVAQAHANGLEVHPWLVAFRVSSVWPPAGNDILAAHPEWLMVMRSDMGGGPAKVSEYYTLDPGSPDVQEYLMAIVDELVNNYDVDGIHWDYIRYTDPNAGYPAYTWYPYSGLERFKAITGYAGTPAIDYEPWNDFRRQGITEVVRRAQVVTATGDNPRQPLRHSAALITWGDAPTSFEDTSSWARFQNWRLWMDEGYLDAGVPMTYYDYDSYPSWYRHWVDRALTWRYDRHIFTGPGVYLNDFADSVTEIAYAQDAGTNGICTYSYAQTSESGADWSWYTDVAPLVFPEPAPTPTMTWRDPATTTEGYVYGRVTDGLTGAPIDDATIKINGFILAQTDGNGFYVVTHVSAGPAGTQRPMAASYAGYAEVLRPAVLIQRAGYTEANFALGAWLAGDYDVDGDVDWRDFGRVVPAVTGPDNGPPPAGGDVFDFDLDDDLDLEDLAVFQASFSG